MLKRHLALAIVLGVLLLIAVGLAVRDSSAGSAPSTTTTTATTNARVATTTTIDQEAFGRWIRATSETTTTTTLAPSPPSTSPPTVVSSAGCAYEAQIRAAFPGDGDWAVMVAWRESRCQPGAVNWAETCAPGSNAKGLFQMCHPLHAPTFAAVGCTDPLNAECNIRAAAHLYAGSGRSPWRMG